VGMAAWADERLGPGSDSRVFLREAALQQKGPAEGLG